MRHTVVIILATMLAGAAKGEVLVEENFEDENLKARSWFDIAKWGEEKSLSIVGEPEVKAKTGKRCLKIRYAEGDTGGWMHIRLKKEVPEVYVRYYRLFPEGWEWPKGYGPHDSIAVAGSYGVPTDTDLSVYLDFWKSGDTFVRVATARQKWGYGGYGQILRKHGGVANRVAYNVSNADKVELGKWHCVEYYAKLSDPGKENGCLKLWVNGKLVSDLEGLPLVDEKHGGILFNRWMLGPYFHGGSHKEQWNYLDSLVISTEYIGTLEQDGNQPPRARFTYTRDWGSMMAVFDASKSSDPDGEIAKFSWEFGDGKIGKGKTVQHNYTQTGEYTVKLTVVDENGQSHSSELTISVAPNVGSGNGLKAEYYDNEELKGKPIIRTEKQIAFQRGGWNGRFLRGEVGDNNGDHYSCRWTGFLQPTHSEEYTLTFEVNDGGRVWFDGKLVIDAWDEPQTKSTSVGNLVAGKKYLIRVEHHKGIYEATGDWKAGLFWESSSFKKELIPPTQFYLPATSADSSNAINGGQEKMTSIQPVYPGSTWETKTPAEVSMDAAKLDAFRDLVSGRGCVVRYGYMVYTWGDVSKRADVASAAKPWYSHFLFKALEEGKIARLDEKLAKWEPRLDTINQELGYKDQNITWRHTANQTSCYGITEPPGAAFDYNDWQMALFWDTLFLKVYGTAYENVDEKVLHPLLTDPLQCEDNPTLMAFGMKDRPGRVAVSVRDFTRFGLLYLRQGNWKGKQLIRQEHAAMAVTNPLPDSIPRAAGQEAEMIPSQRSMGSRNIPDNQCDHLGSYSWLWWTNGIDREGKRHWADVPVDAYGAFGHGGPRAMVVIPSLDLVMSWNDADVHSRDKENQALKLLVDAVIHLP